MIGYFGGTFDPIHLGHLHLATQALHSLQLEKVYFVPTGQNPLKKRGPRALATQRLHMVRSALQENANPAFSAIDAEVFETPPSYTVDTLMRLQTQEPGDWVLLLGQEVYAEIDKWKDPKKLRSIVNIAVFQRPREKQRHTPWEGGQEGPKWVRLLPLEALPYSATRIREQLAELNAEQRKSELPPVPGLQRSVWQYIKEYQLYTVV